MLNVKQGSCEYQLLKYFGLTRPGNRTLVYRLRGERSKFLGNANESTVLGGDWCDMIRIGGNGETAVLVLFNTDFKDSS